MRKQDLIEFIKKNKPRTALDYLLLIVQKYDEYSELKDSIILNMAHWSQLNNDSFKHISSNGQDWHQLNNRVLNIINQLPVEKDFEVRLTDSVERLKIEIDSIQKGNVWRKRLKRSGILLAILFFSALFYFTFDGKRLAFEHLFKDIMKNITGESIGIFDYAGAWNLYKPYIIRRDTINEFPYRGKIFLTVGEEANAHFFLMDSNRIGGIEYIKNSLYEVDTSLVKEVEKEFTHITSGSVVKNILHDKARKVETISVVFHETIETDALSREGHLIGNYSPENNYLFRFKSAKHRNLVNRIIEKYNAAPKRMCKVNATYPTLLTFDCKMVNEPDKQGYLKMIKKK